MLGPQVIVIKELMKMVFISASADEVAFCPSGTKYILLNILARCFALGF
jgi:hypothetical protein